MKISFKPRTDDEPLSAASRKSSTSGAVKLNLKLNDAQDPAVDLSSQILASPAVQSAAADAPKPKRKYTKKPKPDQDADRSTPAKADKKRKLKEDDTGESERGSAKRQNNGPKGSGIKLRLPSMSTVPTAEPSTVSAKPSNTARPKIVIPSTKHVIKSRTASTPHIKIKSRGLPPPRPVAQGYDSEAEDIEIDPAIESQLILRMQPGEDCDYLRRAIQEKKIGLRVSEGGADVSMRFLTERRVVVTIRGRNYAACLLDLPCIIEAMKSWDRRGWYKAADICQILLVLGRVNTDEEARNFPLPREVDQRNHQYPHGLTPPMHLVRKRRFRKRVSNLAILEVESEVRRLLQADDEAKSHNGRTEYTLLDTDEALSRDGTNLDNMDNDDMVQDEYGAVVPGYEDMDGDDAEGEIDEMAELMEQEFAQSHHGTASAGVPAVALIADHLRKSPESTLPSGATPQPGASPAPTERSAETGGGRDADHLFSGDEDDAEEADDDDDEDEDEDEVDEAELARQQELAQLKEEVEDLRKEITDAEKAMQKQANPLLKQRAAGKVRSLKEDLRLKLASLGEDDGE